MFPSYNPDWSRTSTSTGYEVVFCPEHPRAWSTGYVYVHQIRAEEKLGRLLRKGEVVHHRDGNRRNNALSNLEVLSPAAHAKEHAKPQVLVPLRCDYCGLEFSRRKGNEGKVKKYKRNFCSRPCNGKFYSTLKSL